MGLFLGNSKIKVISGNSTSSMKQFPPPMTNQVPISTDADGSIYNDIGYRVGYRVRSGGAEIESEYCICTGYIPFKKGDTLRIYPNFSGGNTENAINFFDGDLNCFGQVVDGGTCYGSCTLEYKTSIIDGVTTLTLSAANSDIIRYVRITHWYWVTGINKGKNMIVTVNEKLS